MSQHETKSNDEVWCMEQLDRYASPWRLVQAFLPQEQRETHLAVLSVMYAIANIAFEINDPETALRKLDWWYKALLQLENETSVTTVSATLHPGLRQWQRLGIDEQLSSFNYQPWLQAIAELVQAQQVVSVESLWQHCQKIGEPIQQMLTQSVDSEMSGDWCSAWLLLRQIEHFAYVPRFWWLIPLDLRAKHRLQLDSERLEFDVLSQRAVELPMLFEVLSEPIDQVLDGALTQSSKLRSSVSNCLICDLWRVVIIKRNRDLVSNVKSICQGKVPAQYWKSILGCWAVARRYQKQRH